MLVLATGLTGLPAERKCESQWGAPGSASPGGHVMSDAEIYMEGNVQRRYVYSTLTFLSSFWVLALQQALVAALCMAAAGLWLYCDACVKRIEFFCILFESGCGVATREVFDCLLVDFVALVC